MLLTLLGLTLGVLLIVLGGIRIGAVKYKFPYVSLILVGGLFVVLAVLRISGFAIGR